MMRGHYTPIDFVSTTLSDFGNIQPGYVREEYDDTNGYLEKYILVKAAGTVTANSVAAKHTTSGVYDVVICPDNAAFPVGVNTTGASRTVGQYFWLKCSGQYTVLDAAGGIATVGECVGLHATTDGNADTFVPGTSVHCIGTCMVASSGGVAVVRGTFPSCL